MKRALNIRGCIFLLEKSHYQFDKKSHDQFERFEQYSSLVNTADTLFSVRSLQSWL